MKKVIKKNNFNDIKNKSNLIIANFSDNKNR